MSFPSWMGVLSTWLTGCWGEGLTLWGSGPGSIAMLAGGRVKPEYRAWSHWKGLGLSWLLVLLPVVIVLLLFILFSELR